MAFVSKTITERTQIAARQSVKEGGVLSERIDIFVQFIKLLFNHFRIHVPRLCEGG